MERREYLIGSDDCDDQDVAERADEDDDAEDQRNENRRQKLHETTYGDSINV